MLALIAWIYPMPAQSKQKVSLPISTYQENKQPYGPIRPAVPLGQSKKLSNRLKPPQVKTNSVETTLRNKAGSERKISQIRAFDGRNYTKEEVRQLIIDYSAQYGINPAVPLCIAQKESGFNQFSANKSSSAKGVFQYLNGTWKATDEGKAGLSVFDANANIRAAIKYMASRKNTKPWVVGKKCPSL